MSSCNLFVFNLSFIYLTWKVSLRFQSLFFRGVLGVGYHGRLLYIVFWWQGKPELPEETYTGTGRMKPSFLEKMMAFRCWARPKRGKDIWQQHIFRECPCVFIFLVQKNSFIIQVQVVKFLCLYSSQKLFSVMWYQYCSLLHVIYLHAKHYCFFF